MSGRGWTSAAFEEAARLGSGYAGAEHFLLALLRPGQETIAAQALRDCGAEYDALSSALERAHGEARDGRTRDGISLNPAAQALVGRAEGLAAGLGVESLKAEHVLLALIWRPELAWPLAAAGTTREAAYERLRARGVRLAVEPPPSREPPARPEQRVYFPQSQLRDVLARLPALLPPDSDLRWNLDGPFRAWVEANGDFELRERVRRALAGAPA